MLKTTPHLRALTPDDLPELHGLLDRDPLVNLFVRNRVDATRLQARWLGGQVWGYFEDDVLVSACHAGANVVPVQATRKALAAFAERVLADNVRPSSIVGLRDAVLPFWEMLEPRWGPARSPRLSQPFMTLRRDSRVAPDPRVRPVLIDEFDVLYPASVAMFTEEVGVDPEVGNRTGYRARVAQLISQGWSFAIIEDGRVLFKTEVGAATTEACQLQGVYVHPELRGRGLAVPAMAAVVQQVRRTVAPVVTLYVNDHNTAARRTYERVGFEHTATFASVLL
ncbi:GNAT family N-acetyltransferase [Aeromicrobium fastidiosum]|uniref:GNAT family N-acetyltransferase n=1 Tax=Aeromicrobium TaxID=2040 RepID=UPI00177ED68C|nr:GNAT family N-acetyltransferase [Aeromicrobium fastidiosum]MBD8605923.1 GNAT family N-acetyltransferase [Aeromicrobium sp. CFBP 8757]MCL8250224.1 GNAT family N-acetyltransferase [Aeromicrobium fastidiosum]